jgi:tetratricopeptide (TPR) repeat protein
MRKILIQAACLGSACIFGATASAGVMVVGDSPGYGCYQAARQGGRSQEALATCDRALATGALDRGDEVATYVNRGIVKMHRGTYDLAIDDFNRAIALDPRQPESYLNKGSAILRSGAGGSTAIALFSEALERKTARPEFAYFGRAVAHEEAGDLKSAYFDYRRVHDANPRWGEPAEELKRFQVRQIGG